MECVVKQVDIIKATYREIDRTPGHITYGVWINGGKCGDLTIRIEEEIAFNQMFRTMFRETVL